MPLPRCDGGAGAGDLRKTAHPIQIEFVLGRIDAQNHIRVFALIADQDGKAGVRFDSMIHWAAGPSPLEAGVSSIHIFLIHILA